MKKFVFPLIFSIIFLSLFSVSMINQTAALESGYRAIDGSGNNGDKGKAGEQLFRTLPNGYEDGFSVPRGGDNNPPGSNLPSARAISNAISDQSSSSPDPSGVSDLFWLWGQFIDHDIDLTGGTSESFDILVDFADDFNPPGFIPLSRSVFENDGGGVRQQINQITSFLDASMVYGSDITRNNFIRDLDANNGKLKLDAKGLLPLNTDGLDNAATPTFLPEEFFLAGDVRANEHAGLTAMHTLLVREHNRLVDEISAITGETDEDVLYQEARIIVEGKIQYITYNEFLPILLGPNAIPSYSGYNSGVNPQIANEFSTAAYRVGHTMLSNTLERINEDGTPFSGGDLPLKMAFFNPQILKDDGIEPLLLGMATGKAEKVDPLLVDDVRNFLFGPPGAGGFDLASLNIQRGRDHGLPSYNEARDQLGLGKVNSFSEITGDPNDNVGMAAKFASVYANVDEVDLWTGGLAEPYVNGGMVGETFAKILKDQFQRIRDGDQFWYQNRDLNPMQMQMIEQGGLSEVGVAQTSNSDQTTLASLIERNTSMSMQQNVFVAEPRIDSDSDGIMDFVDNCPGVPNANQLDSNNNGIGDVCERKVGGEMIPIDTTALLVYGAGNLSIWIIPIIVSAIVAYYFVFKKGIISRQKTLAS